MKFAFGIEVVFLAGGIAKIIIFSSPRLFTVADWVGDFIPVIWLESWL